MDRGKVLVFAPTGRMGGNHQTLEAWACWLFPRQAGRYPPNGNNTAMGQQVTLTSPTRPRGTEERGDDSSPRHGLYRLHGWLSVRPGCGRRNPHLEVQAPGTGPLPTSDRGWYAVLKLYGRQPLRPAY
jgi:hypothetical protein